ncbi:MAG: amino acid adenylation domain-containing protein [Bryobacteraceae bacterium]
MSGITKFDLDAGSGLTRNQFFIWLGQEASPGIPLFNELTVFVLESPIDRSLFSQAVQMVVNQTDALRTVVRQVDGLPRAEVLDHFPCTSSYIDLSVTDDPDSALDHWARGHVDSAVDISVHCFESTLLKLSEHRYAWALLLHHILSDATSMAITYQRVGDCYKRLVDGADETPLQYPRFADYVEYEAAYRQSERHSDCESYWQSKLAEHRDPVTFYGGRARTSEHGLRRERLEFRLGAEQSAAIRQLARTEGVRFISDDLSIFSIFAAALFVYLFRVSGQQTLAIGVPWQNRPRSFRETVGLLMEQDPFFVSLDASDTFESLIRKVHAETRNVMRNLPYAAGNPGGRVYEVSLNYVKTTLGSFAGIPVKPLWYRPSYGTGSIECQVHDFGDSGDMSVSFDFNSEFFSPLHRDSAVAHFMNCLTACIEDRSQAIGSVGLLTSGEHALLAEWNATTRDYPHDHTVVALFEAQVARRPTALAARCGDASLTYETLDRRASALAQHLRSLGVAPGVLVGLCLERSLDMLVGLLGILKAGGTYVPLDPAFPAERLAFMLADSGAPLLLTETRVLGAVDAGTRQVVILDTLQLDDATGHESVASKATPDDLAYVLYTSGSTGKPKGVEIPHRALTNFLWAMRTEPGCSQDDVVLAVTTLSFDIAGLELFLPLIVGGQVEIVSRSVAADGRLLRARLDAGGVSLLQATPATWRMLLDAGWAGTPGLKALIGGESLPADLVPLLLARTASLWNMYGPTETTIWSSVQQVTRTGEEITVGVPIANTTFHVVDARLNPVPIGVAGELLIGGDGLARGYRERADLTAEKFIVNQSSAAPGARLYRTGDLARYRTDGQVVHLGRLDYQVKIRGFRIELGEIEAALGTHPSVRQSAVIALAEPAGQARLVGYFVPALDAEPDPSALRDHLRLTLPPYMVPNQFVRLDELPLTPNGKIDRKRLPKPETEELGAKFVVAPRTPVETRVVALFAEALGVPQLGIHDDFFDLGGDSLKALRLMVALENEFQCEHPLQTLYEAPTVAQISEIICKATGAEGPPAEHHAGGHGDAQSTTERRLAEIWTALLGVEGVSRDASFVDRQGSRALLLPMLAEVRSQFGVMAEGISAVAFEAEPTIAGLARAIEANAAATSTIVVPLQPRGGERPIFLIHAGGGYVFFYRALAVRLGPNRPVFGVRAMTRSDRGGQPFDRYQSIEELAAQYIEEIQTIQRHGPYTLGGACFGGVVAFEMARQLRAKGETISSPILLFDSFPELPGQNLPTASILAAALSRTLAQVDATHDRETTPTIQHVARLATSNPSVGWRLTSNTIREVVGRLRTTPVARNLYWQVQRFRVRHASLETKQLKTMEHFLENTLRLLRRYSPVPYPGSAILFKAAVGDDPEPLWRPLFTDGVQTHTMPGKHLDMMEEPAVIEMATAVRQHLSLDQLLDEKTSPQVDRTATVGERVK